MATYYVDPTGTDDTSHGTASGTGAWKTINYALSQLPAAGGDTLLLGAGTYVEDSGSGYLSVNRQFTARTTISTASGKQDVTIKGGGTAWSVIYSNPKYQHWDNIIFEAQANTVQAAVRFVAATVEEVAFTRCRFTAYSNPSVANLAVTTAWTTTGVDIVSLEFDACEVSQIGPYVCGGMVFDAQTGTRAVVRIHGCNVRSAGLGIRMLGITDAQVTNNDVQSWHPVSGATAFQIGVDGATGRTCGGLVMGNRFRSVSGHGSVVGVGCGAGLAFVSNTVVGGNSTSVGQGLVIKEAVGSLITRNIVRGGYLSGLYLKGASSCQVLDNWVWNYFATSAALRIGVNSDSGTIAHDNTIRRNVFIAAAGKAMDWGDSTQDSGGSLCDENVYAAIGAATLGAAAGTSVTTLTGLRAAWASAGYSQRNNDRNSLFGVQHLPPGGPPLVDLPAA